MYLSTGEGGAVRGTGVPLNMRGRRALVIGAGRSGMAAAALLTQQGAVVRMTEQRPEMEWAENAVKLRAMNVEIEAGGHRVESVEWVGQSTGEQSEKGFVVVSPGVASDHPLIQAAKARGVDVFPEVDVASWFIRDTIIGVTGTKGKTTTVTLIGLLLRAAGIEAVVAGNIGTALSSVALTPDPPSPLAPRAGFGDGPSRHRRMVIVELSSFQLELVRTLQPSLGVVLNITEDHLDRHRSMDVYASAKANLLRRLRSDGVAILNAESPQLEWLQRSTSAKVWRFSSVRPVSPGVWVGGAEREIISDLWSGQAVSICRVDELLMKGVHNVENAMAAIAVAVKYGAPLEAVRQTLVTFAGVAHRQEYVGMVDGVTFVNNSQGTNIDAVVKSLMSYDAPIILIAGGRSKGARFEQLRALVSAKVKHLLCIGEAAEALAAALDGCAPSIIRCASLESAVVRAHHEASPGDVVLLSPICTSFDMFRDYEHRGEVFRDAVKSLDARSKSGLASSVRKRE